MALVAERQTTAAGCAKWELTGGFTLGAAREPTGAAEVSEMPIVPAAVGIALLHTIHQFQLDIYNFKPCTTNTVLTEQHTCSTSSLH